MLLIIEIIKVFYWLLYIIQFFKYSSLGNPDIRLIWSINYTKFIYALTYVCIYVHIYYTFKYIKVVYWLLYIYNITYTKLKTTKFVQTRGFFFRCTHITYIILFWLLFLFQFIHGLIYMVIVYLVNIYYILCA